MACGEVKQQAVKAKNGWSHPEHVVWHVLGMASLFVGCCHMMWLAALASSSVVVIVRSHIVPKYVVSNPLIKWKLKTYQSPKHETTCFGPCILQFLDDLSVICHLLPVSCWLLWLWGGGWHWLLWLLWLTVVLGNTTGNPGVSQAKPYPYPSNPTLNLAGRGLAGTGLGFHVLNGGRLWPIYPFWVVQIYYC